MGSLTLTCKELRLEMVGYIRFFKTKLTSIILIISVRTIYIYFGYLYFNVTRRSYWP